MDQDALLRLNKLLLICKKLVKSNLISTSESTDLPEEALLSDSDIMSVNFIFDNDEDTWAPDTEYRPGQVIKGDDGYLYRIVNKAKFTSQSSQPPSLQPEMSAVYRRINKEHSGKLDDPIPYVDSMDTKKNKYYSYNGHIYLCNLKMSPCVWAPDTPGLWQWTLIS